MDVQQILQALDAVIARLLQAGTLLSQTSGGTIASTATASMTKRRGRPPLSKSVAQKPIVKRRISEEGKARIVAAQKKRWAKSKRAAKVLEMSSVAKTTTESTKRGAAKRAAGTTFAQTVKKATPSKRSVQAKRSSDVKRVASALSRKKPQAAKKNRKIVAVSAVQQLVDTLVATPTTAEITEATA